MFFEYYYYFGDDAKKCHISDAKKKPFFDYLKDNYSVKLQHSQKKQLYFQSPNNHGHFKLELFVIIIIAFCYNLQGKIKKENNLNYCVSIWNNLFVIEKKKNTMKMTTAVKC